MARRERLFQVGGSGLARGFPPLRTPAHVAGNLPAAATSFVGHGDELRRLAADLPLRRLITLTGVGGVGKTRLSLHVAAELSREGAFTDGVFFVPLAAVRQAGAVIPAIAQTLRAHWDDGEIVELTGVVALFGFLNRWNDAMATELEAPAAADGQRWLSGHGWTAGKHGS